MTREEELKILTEMEYKDRLLHTHKIPSHSQEPMNSKIEEIIEKFDEKFNFAQPTPKQCGIAYPSQMELWAIQREAFYKAKDFLKSSLIEYGEAIRQEIVASPENSANRIIQAVAEERKSLLEKVEKMDGIKLNHTPLGNGRFISLESVKELLK
jgi:hypothetical protein